MDLFVYDTKSRQKRKFEPIDPNCVTIYVCGPTVYDRAHIGNAVPAVIFDVLVRLLRVLFPKVRYVANLTDIDDKINKKAMDIGEPISTVTVKFIDYYRQDMAGLGVLPPDVEPKATEHIEEIIDFIVALIDADFAYPAEGHVLFHVPALSSYGSLSKRSLDDMKAGARVEVAPYKRDPRDFILWKPSSDELPGWDSPWGRGRPGWHIECSAMIQKHLGQTIDIHGGGADLQFPHHENELAQSSCIAGQEYVRNWMHNGLLEFGGNKMAKSVGNVVTVGKLLKQYSGETIRYAILSGHYRQNLQWDDRLLEQAEASVNSFYHALRNANEQLGDLGATENGNEPSYSDHFLSCLCDDLATPRALADLHRQASELNKTQDRAQLSLLRRQFISDCNLLGLLTQSPHEYFQSTTADIDPAKIDSLIEARAQARSQRNYKEADRIRDELASLGVSIEDTRNGTLWRISNR